MNLNYIWTGLVALLNAALSKVFVFLPVSPFKDSLGGFSDYTVLQYVNWFVPIGDLLTITSLWLSAIVIFYAYQIILRWIKAIDD